MPKAHFLVGLLFLSGCASSVVEQTNAPLMLLKQQSNLCFLNLKDDPELAYIADYVALESLYEDEAHFELLNNSDFPTLTEIAVINKWAAKLERCYKIKRETYVHEEPGVVRCLVKLENEQKSWVQTLASGKITYGQFATSYYFAYSNNRRKGHNGCDG
jgi:hypothetical protein